MFTPAPFLSFLTALNLRGHLVQSKLYSFQRTTGSYKCNSPRCQVVKECYQFSSHVTEETFKINHYFDCNSKSLIYMISCKACDKQYVVSAMKRFRLWWNNNTSLANEKVERREDCIQKYLHEQFLGENHKCFMNEAEIIFIDKTDLSDRTRRE